MEMHKKKINRAAPPLEICPFKLNLDEDLRGNFRLKLNKDLPLNINKANGLLLSTIPDEQRLGAFVYRRFTIEILLFIEKKNEQQEDFKFYVDDFIANKSFETIGELLSKTNDPYIKTELLWSLINFTNFTTSDLKFDYLNVFLTPSYIAGYKSCLKDKERSVGQNLFSFLFNLCLENSAYIQTLIDCNFITESIEKFKNVINSKEEKNEIVIFFSLLAKSPTLPEKFQVSLFSIFSLVLCISNDRELINKSVFGLFLILNNENKRNKNLDELIRNNHLIKSIMSLDFKEFYEERYTGITAFAVRTVNLLLKRMQMDGDLMELTKEITNSNIFSTYSDIYFYFSGSDSREYVLKGIYTMGLSNNSDYLKWLLDDENVIKILKDALKYSDYQLRLVAVKFFYNALSLKDFDIARTILQKGIVDLIVSILNFDKQSEILKLAFNCIKFLINIGDNVKTDLNNPFLTYLKQRGLEDTVNKEFDNLNDEAKIVLDEVRKLSLD